MNHCCLRSGACWLVCSHFEQALGGVKALEVIHFDQAPGGMKAWKVIRLDHGTETQAIDPHLPYSR